MRRAIEGEVRRVVNEEIDAARVRIRELIEIEISKLYSQHSAEAEDER